MKPLPSVQGAQHVNITSSGRPSILVPTWVGHPTYIYAQIRVCFAHTTPICVAPRHISSTSSCHRSVLNPKRTGHPTYFYAQVRVRSAHLHHCRSCGGPVSHTVPPRVNQASTIPHRQGTQHTCIYLHVNPTGRLYVDFRHQYPHTPPTTIIHNRPCTSILQAHMHAQLRA